MEQLSQSWSSVTSDVVNDGVALSLLASFGTGLGAVPVLFTSRFSERWKTLLLSIGSGVMLAAAAFSLLIPAWVMAGHSAGYGVGTGTIIGATVVGAGLFYGLETVFSKSDSEHQTQARHLWLFVLAIALHHFPEGLAVGLGVESTHDASIALGVALQNLPEGLMVALALRQLGHSLGVALALAAVSGWLEPLGGLLGVTLVGLGATVAPVGMAVAAGGMLFVVLHELLPQLSLKTSSSSIGLVAGLTMMGLVEQLL
ncbi:MAG: ZIP family metal transporter [Cyanobacteria bacterium P01_H01_bin.21]